MLDVDGQRRSIGLSSPNVLQHTEVVALARHVQLGRAAQVAIEQANEGLVSIGGDSLLAPNVINNFALVNGQLPPRMTINVDARALNRFVTEAVEPRKRLIESNTGLIEEVIRRHGFRPNGTQVEWDDIYGMGHEGLIDAVDTFDPDMGTRISTHAYWRIRAAIGRRLRTDLSLVYVPDEPRSAFYDAMRESDNMPSDPEMDRIKKLTSPASLSRPVGEDGTRETLADFVPAVQESFDISVTGIDDPAEALTSLMASLDEVTRSAVFMRYAGRLTVTEIAKELGLSELEVDKMTLAAMRQLRKQGREMLHDGSTESARFDDMPMSDEQLFTKYRLEKENVGSYLEKGLLDADSTLVVEARLGIRTEPLSFDDLADKLGVEKVDVMVMFARSMNFMTKIGSAQRDSSDESISAFSLNNRVIEQCGMSIDEVLGYIDQLTSKRKYAVLRRLRLDGGEEEVSFSDIGKDMGIAPGNAREHYVKGVTDIEVTLYFQRAFTEKFGISVEDVWVNLPSVTQRQQFILSRRLKFVDGKFGATFAEIANDLGTSKEVIANNFNSAVLAVRRLQESKDLQNISDRRDALISRYGLTLEDVKEHLPYCTENQMYVVQRRLQLDGSVSLPRFVTIAEELGISIDRAEKLFKEAMARLSTFSCSSHVDIARESQNKTLEPYGLTVSEVGEILPHLSVRQQHVIGRRLQLDGSLQRPTFEALAPEVNVKNGENTRKMFHSGMKKIQEIIGQQRNNG